MSWTEEFEGHIWPAASGIATRRNFHFRSLAGPADKSAVTRQTLGGKAASASSSWRANEGDTTVLFRHGRRITSVRDAEGEIRATIFGYTRNTVGYKVFSTSSIMIANGSFTALHRYEVRHRRDARSTRTRSGPYRRVLDCSSASLVVARATPAKPRVIETASEVSCWTRPVYGGAIRANERRGLDALDGFRQIIRQLWCHADSRCRTSGCGRRDADSFLDASGSHGDRVRTITKRKEPARLSAVRDAPGAILRLREPHLLVEVVAAAELTALLRAAAIGCLPLGRSAAAARGFAAPRPECRCCQTDIAMWVEEIRLEIPQDR